MFHINITIFYNVPYHFPLLKFKYIDLSLSRFLRSLLNNSCSSKALEHVATSITIWAFLHFSTADVISCLAQFFSFTSIAVVSISKCYFSTFTFLFSLERHHAFQYLQTKSSLIQSEVHASGSTQFSKEGFIAALKNLARVE